MKKILLYIILFLSGIDGAWALPIEKEGMSIYSPSLKQEVSYSIILPEGCEHSETEYPVLYMFHGIGGDYTSWLEYGNVARVMDKMIKDNQSFNYNLGSGSGYSVKEIIDNVKKVTGKDFKVEYVERRAGDPGILIADSAKAEKELDWKPQYSLEQIVISAWKWETNRKY